MRKSLPIVTLVLALVALKAGRLHAGEEKIRGMLEKTAKPDSSAQITDALNDIYYLEKNDATEKLVAGFIGKNQKVVVTGTVESKPNDTHFFINVKAVEAFTPKLPPAPPPPPPPPPPAAEKKDEPKPEAKKDEPKPEVKKDEPKKDEPKKDAPK